MANKDVYIRNTIFFWGGEGAQLPRQTPPLGAFGARPPVPIPDRLELDTRRCESLDARLHNSEFGRRRPADQLH